MKRRPMAPIRFVAAVIIATFALGVLSPSVGANAQPSEKRYRVGWLSPTLGQYDATLPFLEKLRELGWVEGKHFVMEKRFAPAGQNEQLATLATELVEHHVDIIIAVSTPGALAAKQATTTIPIVMAGIGDPVGSGLVESLARPGGNITGLSARPTQGFFSKQLELLKEVAPHITRVGMLYNDALNLKRLPPEQRRRAISQWRNAAQKLGLTVVLLIAREPREYPQAFATFTRERAEALWVGASAMNVEHQQRIVDFVMAKGVPAIAGTRSFVRKGGLLSYYTSWGDLRRRTAVYVDKILKGANPSDLPVEQPLKFNLVVNLKTAEAIGLTIPPSIRVLADEVIK